MNTILNQMFYGIDERHIEWTGGVKINFKRKNVLLMIFFILLIFIFPSLASREPISRESRESHQFFIYNSGYRWKIDVEQK